MAQREFILPRWGELEDDDRTEFEQLRDLGVIPNPPIATNCVWFPKSIERAGRKQNWDISFTKTAVSFSENAYKAIGPYVILGIGRIKGDTVLLINPTEDEKKGYKISILRKATTPRYTIVAQKLVARLHAEGLAVGRYRLVQGSEGKFAAILIKDKAKKG